MIQHARDLTSAPTTHETGVVIAVDAHGFTVRTDAGDFTARRAVSCLVQPEPDDVVLLAVVPRRACYVLAVLERSPGAAARLVTDGDLDIHVGRGKLNLMAQHGVAVVTGATIDVAAGALTVQAGEGAVTFGALSVLSDVVRAELAEVKLEAGAVEAVVERVIERVKRSYRTVEEFDHLRAGVIDYAARETLKLRGDNAVVTATELVKVDGAQIHLG